MGELYMVDVSTGERTLISGTIKEFVNIPVEPEPVFFDNEFFMPASATITVRVDRNALLSIIYGHNITNNWLKYHGGVMSRKIHRRYRV